MIVFRTYKSYIRHVSCTFGGASQERPQGGLTCIANMPGNMSEIGRVAVIGGGNMGGAIARGIVKAGLARPSDITVTRRSPTALESWAAEGFPATADNAAAVRDADVVILAVKPYQIESVIAGVKDSLRPGVIAVSIVSGVSIAHLTDLLGEGTAIVRVIPNTAVEVGESFSAIAGGPSASKPQIETVERIFSALGMTYVTDEGGMPALTAIASCGTAFALRYIRACQESAIQMGISAATAAQVAAQTVKGAAQLILSRKSHPEEEIDRVCTPGGSTITGVNAMERAGFTRSVIEGMMAAFDAVKH